MSQLPLPIRPLHLPRPLARLNLPESVQEEGGADLARSDPVFQGQLDDLAITEQDHVLLRHWQVELDSASMEFCLWCK